MGRKHIKNISSPVAGDRLLLVKYSALGDVVNVTSVLSCLRHHFPEMSISWLLSKEYVPLMEGQGLADDIISWDREKGFRGFIKILKKIRKEHFDWLLDMQWVDRSAVIALLSGASLKVGYHKSLSWIYDRSPGNRWSDDLPLLERQGVVADGLGIHDCSNFDPVLIPPLCDNIRIDLLKKADAPIILGIIGASRSHKRWPVKRWVEFIGMAMDNGYKVAVTGFGDDEREMADSIIDKVGGHQIIDLVGRLNLQELAKAMSLCSGVVGGDTGPLHMAVAIKVPTVALFGPTPFYSAFAGGSRSSVLCCSCPRKGCKDWLCPNVDCLGDISAERVMENLSGLMSV